MNGQTVGPGTISFDLMGGNAIVVLLSSESIDQYSVTFAGEALTEAAHAENPGAMGPGAPQDVGLFYLIDPASTSGDLEITGVSTTADNAGLGYSYVALSGVAGLGKFNPEGAGGSNSGDVTLEHTTAAGGFVFGNGCNNASELANSPIYVSGLANMELQRTFLDLGGSGHLHHYGEVLDDGIHLETFNFTNSRDAFIVVSFNPLGGKVLLGDVNCDGVVDLLDVAPFVEAITLGIFDEKADVNEDGVVDLLDVAPFVAILTGG